MAAKSSGGWVQAAFGGLQVSVQKSGAREAASQWPVCFATDIPLWSPLARRELFCQKQQHTVAMWLNVEVKAHPRSLRTMASDCRCLAWDFAIQSKQSGVRVPFPSAFLGSFLEFSASNLLPVLAMPLAAFHVGVCCVATMPALDACVEFEFRRRVFKTDAGVVCGLKVSTLPLHQAITHITHFVF